MDIQSVLQLAKDSYRYARHNDKRLEGKIIDFYREGQKNPSVAKVIMKHATLDGCMQAGELMLEDIGSLRGKPHKLIMEHLGKSILALANIENIKKAPAVSPLVDNFEKTYRELYPKTYELRNKLIEDGRVCFKEIKPCLPKSFGKIFKYVKFFV